MNPNIKLTFAWEGAAQTGTQLAELFINDLIEAAKTNWDDYDHLQEIRQTSLLVAMAMQKRMGELRYPGSARPSEPPLEMPAPPDEKKTVCVADGRPARYLLHGSYYCTECRAAGVMS